MTFTGGDRNFPFIAPAFLFIHHATLYFPSEEYTDKRGNPLARYSQRDVTGYLTAPDPGKEETAGSERVKYDAIFLTPADIDLHGLCFVKCEDPQLPPSMKGKYRVDVVRPTIAHSRVMLYRYTGAWEYDDALRG